MTAEMRPSDRLAASGLPLAPGGVVRPSGESTSAALRRVTAERDQAFVDRDNAYDALTDVLAERDEARAAFNGSIGIRARLVDRALTLRSQRDAARAEVETLRHSEGVDLTITRAELSSAREELERLRAGRSWIVARDGGRDCLDCDREIRRGEAYELVPGEGPDALRHVHCRDEEKSMSTSTTDGSEHPSTSPEEHYMIGEHLLRGCEALAEVDHPAAASQAAIAHAHFTAAAAGAAMRGMELMLHPQRTVQVGEPPAVQHGEQGDPWWNEAADHYEATCLCGETFSAWAADAAAEALLTHRRREGSDV